MNLIKLDLIYVLFLITTCFQLIALLAGAQMISNNAGKQFFTWQTCTAQKMRFSIKDFLSRCDQIRKKLDLVAFAESILNEKLHFLCSDDVN